MSEEEIKELRQLSSYIDEALSLCQQELFKSSEMYALESQLTNSLKRLSVFFEDIPQRKAAKLTEGWRMIPKPGYTKYAEATKKLVPFKELINEVLESTTGIRSIEMPSIDPGQSQSLEEAIKDAQILLEKSGAPNAVDRFHTLLHSYLKKQCDDVGITREEDLTINSLLKVLREKHPVLIEIQSTEPESLEILKGMGNTLDKLSTIRNQKSLAHPNVLLSEAEASFIIDSVKTLLGYLVKKLGS